MVVNCQSGRTWPLCHIFLDIIAVHKFTAKHEDEKSRRQLVVWVGCQDIEIDSSMLHISVIMVVEFHSEADITQ